MNNHTLYKPTGGINVCSLSLDFDLGQLQSKSITFDWKRGNRFELVDFEGYYNRH